MKRISGILIATLVSLAFANVALAQQATPEGNVIIRQRVMQGPEGGPPPPPDSNFVFIASESFGGKVVKGAPYSAESVTETIQTLSDGNRIINRMTSSVYRDSEGRTRREQSLKGLGIFGAGEEPLQTIFINDPVAGVTFTLDSRSKTAHKSVPFTFEFNKKLDKAGAVVSSIEGQQFEFRVERGTAATGSRMIMTTPGARMPHPDLDQLRAEAGATSSYAFRTKHGPNANEVKEQLGKQIVEGIEAEGTRTKVTIPAGEIGNERAIEIVSERWYSPELQLVVMTRHSDPRFGETTYKLTNINRTEPARMLFEVPSDYTVKEGPGFGPKIAPLPRKKTNPE
ncbi:MAG TPA: hypothetical protein VJR02_22475 [Pyrinomonadaceae bacterium]|nr:hypothetical protein [Pyrinomonadaceae bacterium]